MLTIDDILSDENIRLAFEHYAKKKTGSGPDGMPPKELKEYWDMSAG